MAEHFNELHVPISLHYVIYKKEGVHIKQTERQ